MHHYLLLLLILFPLINKLLDCSKNVQKMKAMLVCLQGNLPLTYNNGELNFCIDPKLLNQALAIYLFDVLQGKSVYHIPVVIRILEHYPEQPPVVYLRKTPGMNFWLPKHLDADGKVKVPYLTNWHVYVSIPMIYCIILQMISRDGKILQTFLSSNSKIIFYHRTWGSVCYLHLICAIYLKIWFLSSAASSSLRKKQWLKLINACFCTVALPMKNCIRPSENWAEFLIQIKEDLTNSSSSSALTPQSLRKPGSPIGKRTLMHRLDS